MRAVQYFSDEQLAQGRRMKPAQILQFLEDFRELHGARAAEGTRSSTSISLRVPDALLRVFRARAAAAGVPYQTQIKRLMEEWVVNTV
ncbi:MAG: CopG family antitoxin [Woeseiaceae bacterium]